MFQLGGSEAPGPDVFSSLFYQRNWHIIGPDVITTVKAFLRSGAIPSTLNYIDIPLIPKVLSPSYASYFRLISLCNFVYKNVSKGLANRLKVYLLELITLFQSAFVASWMIQDNILVMHEVFHQLQYQTGSGRTECALKVDMQKSYDRVKWVFLIKSLEKRGFGEKWIT